jgi:membrane-bound ClpP family serine protease
MKRYGCCILFFIVIAFFQLEAAYIELNGYLSKEQIEEKKNYLKNESLSKEDIGIIINSTSGDIVETLDFAQFLYEKRLKDQKIVVYIQNSAIGPSAIIPFLASELYVSPLVSWGDIPLGNEKVYSSNLLKNKVVGLIDDNNAKYSLLRTLATAMTDPDVKVVDEKGWKIIPKNQETEGELITHGGETLVINQRQLKELELIQAPISIVGFKEKWMRPNEELPSQRSLETIINPDQINSTLLSSLKDHIKFHEKESNRVGRIVIDDRQNGISQTTWIYVKAALDRYKEEKPIFVILELNTPGGEVFAAQTISDALKELDTQYQIPVVCVINNWAISAGAMLAYSCRYIAVVKDASMGAAEPVIASETGQMTSASEKINSALRTDFSNRAAFFDRNPYIAEAMVDKDLLVVLRNGKIIKLNNENQLITTGLSPDVIISNKGKLLTLNSEELMKYGVADILLKPVATKPITIQEREKGEWLASKELLFHTPFFDKIPEPIIDTYKMDWKTQFFAFLAHPVVASVLFMGLMIGFYMELNTPGASLPGSIAAICLFLIILSSYAQEIGNVLELILLFAGLAAILVEIFVLPSFGLIGFAGILFLLAGLFGLMLPGLDKVQFEWDTSSFNAAGEAVLNQLAWLCGAFILSLGVMWILGRYVMPRFTTFKRFVLSGDEQDASLGYVAGEDPKTLPTVGTKGRVLATLRPSGKVLINETIYDAISNGDFIESGEPVEVIRLDGSVIVVGKKESEKK